MQQSMRMFIDLLNAMTEKELRARYKNTAFGILWIIVNPLLQMVIIGFVFTFFMKNTIQNFHYFLFIGLLVWNFFSSSITRCTNAFVQDRALIKKAKFPHITIPLSIVLSNLIQFISALILFTIPVIFLKTLSIWSLPALLIALILLLLLTTGICLLSSALNVRHRDVNFLVQSLLLVWFYATPIVYILSVIPYRIIWLWRLNPMTAVLQLFQYAFLGNTLPGPAMVTANTLIAVFIFILGYHVFRRESKRFDDWL